MATAERRRAKCTKGWSCGRSCISRAKENCRNGLDGEPKKLADWLGKQAKPTTETKKKDVVARSLPDGVEMNERRNGGERTYTFDVDGEIIKFATGELIQGEEVEVDFSMGDYGSMNTGRIPDPAAAAFAAKRLLRIMQYDASTRPDGFEYKTSAFVDDGRGAERAHGYEKIAGFSRPIDGVYGYYQYGIVRDGRITPNTEKVKSKDTLSEERVQAAMLDSKEERTSNRRARQS